MDGIELVNSADLPAARGHYSHATRAGGFLFVSGQLPVAGDGTVLVDRSFADQTRQTLENVESCLRAAGLDRRHLVQVRVYVTDIAHWPEFDAIYAAWMGESRPARAVAGVAALHYGALLEIEATAAFVG